MKPTDEHLYSSHPLRARRRPGPPGSEVRPQGEQDLEMAQRVLELVEEGVLARGEEPAPLPVACDATGRPLRRLTADDERELAYRIQTYGDLEARNALVLANLGLVHLVSNQMRRPNIRYDDLVQEGTLGLLRATETFEPDRGVRFSTYCVYWIRAKIQRYLQRLDRDDVPSIAGAAMEEPQAGRRRRPRARALSLEMPVDDEEDRTLGEVLSGDDEGPELKTLRRERELAVDRVLADIAAELDDPRLPLIIERRLLAEEPETLAVLGEKLRLSREGARLLESKVLRLAKERLAALSEQQT
ncbi:MAG: sigma-70 family RNA polymerase sigma factor [Myxococcota bacterium]